jgi:hypothetical protein
MDKTRAWAVRGNRSVIDSGCDDRRHGVPRLMLIRPGDRGQASSADGEYRASLRLFRYPARPRTTGSQLTARSAASSTTTTRVLRWIAHVIG